MADLYGDDFFRWLFSADVFKDFAISRDLSTQKHFLSGSAHHFPP
jgi:hypothetical protein